MSGEFLSAKPRPAVYQLPEDTSKIFQRNGENSEDFSEVVKFINYFQEMLKFFPEYQRNGYQNGSEGDTTWYEGFGKVVASKDRGLDNAGKLGAGYEDRFGDWHQVGTSDQFWGYGMGETGGNLEWDPSTYDSNFFTDGVKNKITGADQALDYQDYAAMMAYNPSDSSKYKEIKQSELDSARSFMKQFGNVNFYEFALKGIDKIKFNDKDGNGVFDLNNDGYDTSSCNFMWEGMEGANGEGAFYVMLNLLESRRRIYYAASNVFGQHKNIGDSLAMVKDISDFFDKDVAGADPHNFRMFYMYFAMQHAFRSVTQAFSGNTEIYGDLGGPGFIYSARDRAGFAKFGEWLIGGVNKYISTLSGAEKDRVQGLLSEYKLSNEQNAKSGEVDFNLPYGVTSWHHYSYNDDRYTGWDSFCGNFEKDATKPGYKGLPDYLNPLAVKNGGSHPNYAIAQLAGLKEYNIKGDFALSYNGQNYDLYGTNWVVNLAGRFLKAEDHDTKNAVNTFAMNAYENARYQQETKVYKQNKEAYEEQKYEEEMAIGRAAARAEGRKQQEKKQAEQMSAKQRAEKTAEAKRQLMRQLFSKMLDNSK